MRLARQLIGPLLLAVAIWPAPTLGSDTQVYRSGPQRTQMLELFTSQGCSSCPPAEAWLNGLMDDDRLWTRVIPLAFHVDYWDYLGWRDHFAAPAHSDRQRRYRQVGHVNSVYTPGFVVNGREWRGWFRRRPIPDTTDSAGILEVHLKDGAVRATYHDRQATAGGLVLHLAVLGSGLSSDIGGGENAGRKLTQEFVVLGHRSLESTQSTWSMALPSSHRQGARRLALAAWVSTTEDPTPLQATGGWLTATD